MRDFLEDAEAHRTDGYGRAQAHVRRDLPKRFYKVVTVVEVGGNHAVALDGRIPKTPGAKPVHVPTRALAEAIVTEWEAQGDVIDPMTMPLVRIVNSAVEAGEEARPLLAAEIVKYAANDLMLYRADTPQSLVRRQEAEWDAALVALARHFGVTFQPTIGILHQEQPPVTLAKLHEALASEGLFHLTAMNALTAITGSGLLAMAIRHGLLTPEASWTAAHVDEDHNISLWGEVEEITTRRAQRRRDFDAATRMLTLLG